MGWKLHDITAVVGKAVVGKTTASEWVLYLNAK